MWTIIQESIIKNLGDRCGTLSRDYYSAEKRQRKIHFVLSGLSISSIFFSGMYSFLFPENVISGGILSFSSAFITACNNFLNLSQKAENSRMTRLRFNSLHSEIQNELAMTDDKRYNANSFIIQKQSTFYHIIQSSDTLIFDGDKDNISVNSIKIASDVESHPKLQEIFREE